MQAAAASNKLLKSVSRLLVPADFLGGDDLLVSTPRSLSNCGGGSSSSSGTSVSGDVSSNGDGSSSGGHGGCSSSEECREFERAVEYATAAIEQATCLVSSKATLTCVDARGELSLSFDDWFKLRGLQLCARFGRCDEKWPPWFDYKALRHWQAWRKQGDLAPSEARRRFVQAVATLPGYADRGGSSSVPCWVVVSPCAGPCHINILDICAIRFERPPPRTPTLEEGEASRRRALLRKPQFRGKPGTLESFRGRWVHKRTEGMDEYLQAFGVGLLRRKAATAFVPQPQYFVDRSRLCVSMTTPIGTRIEWLHPNGPPERDYDPQGHSFVKTVHWEGPKLVSTFRSEAIADVVTSRWIEDAADGPMLVQETAFEGVSFTRWFLRMEESDGEAGTLW